MNTNTAYVTKDRTSLAAYLPHDSYDPAGSIFVGRDRSLGMAWEVAFPQAEILDEAGFAAISARFGETLKSFPAGAAVQWILLSNRDVSELLRPWRDDSQTGEASGAKRLLSDHAEMLSRLELDEDGTPFVTRRIRSYLTVRVFPKLTGSDIEKRYEEAKQKLSRVANRVEGQFMESGLSCKRLDASAMKTLLFRLLNPDSARTPSPYRVDLPLRHQVIRTEAAADWTHGIVTLGTMHHRVVSMVETPVETYPGELLFPRSGASILRLVPDSMIVLNVDIQDDYRIRKKLIKQNSFVKNQLQNPKAGHDIRAIGDDVDAALGELLGGGSLVRLRLHVIVWDQNPEGAARKAGTAKRILLDLGMDAVEEEDLALSVFLQSLPLAYDRAFDQGMKRSVPILTSNLGDLGINYGSFKGTATPDVLLQNRRGEPIYFSLFDSNENFNALVTGTSGSGKSYWTNYTMASMLASGAIVFALERGRSYERLCRLFGGRHIELDDPTKPVRINFVGRAGDFNESTLLLVKDLVAEMASQGRSKLRTHEHSAIEEAILAAVEKKQAADNDEVFLSDIHRELERVAKKAKENHDGMGGEIYRLALAMKPFVGNGAFAKYFDGPSSVEFGEGLTVFELGDIATRKDVASVLVMGLLHVIGTFAGTENYLAKKKLVVVDEAWTLLESESTASFLRNAFKTYRKYNTSAMLVTQQEADFSGGAGEAIASNSSNRIFLRQSDKTLAAMERDMNLDPMKKEAIGTLRTVRGQFSEFLIETGDVCGVARLVANPAFYWIATSDGQDKSYLGQLEKRFREEGSPTALSDAIKEAARHGTTIPDPHKGRL